MARVSLFVLLVCAAAALLPSTPAQAVAVANSGRSLANAAMAPSPSDDIDSAEDVADETGEELEEVGGDIEDGTETAVDEVDDAGETAVDEVSDGGEEAVDEIEETGEDAVDEVEEVFTDSASATSLAVALCGAAAGLAALAV